MKTARRLVRRASRADIRLFLAEGPQAVREALAGRSDECQEVLDRFFCRDESDRTIGEELGIASGTIASRISRCLGKLRERFGDA